MRQGKLPDVIFVDAVFEDRIDQDPGNSLAILRKRQEDVADVARAPVLDFERCKIDMGLAVVHHAAIAIERVLDGGAAIGIGDALARGIAPALRHLAGSHQG